MTKMHLFGTATIGSKGQIVIPIEARTELGFEVGDKVLVIGSQSSKSLTIVKPEVIEKYLSEMQDGMQSITNVLKQK